MIEQKRPASLNINSANASLTPNLLALPALPCGPTSLELMSDE